MPTPFTSGQAVRVNRPGKKYHGYLARYCEAGPDDFGFVSMTATGTAPPPLSTFRKQSHFTRRLFPHSQLEAHDEA